MLQNAYFLAKIGADTAENEQHFAEILPKIGNYPTGPDCYSCDVLQRTTIFWQKFGKMLFVFGCIGTDFCK